jgi:hypothetical protein
LQAMRSIYLMFPSEHQATSRDCRLARAAFWETFTTYLGTQELTDGNKDQVARVEGGGHLQILLCPTAADQFPLVHRYSLVQPIRSSAYTSFLSPLSYPVLGSVVLTSKREQARLQQLYHPGYFPATARLFLHRYTN